VLEDLDVRNLVQKGETKKRRMRLYDSSFSELRAVLEWQFRKREKLVLPVPAYNTSRECFLCGRINQNLTLEDRVFLCPHCGFTLDRDLNASLVLLKRAGWVPPVVPVELHPIPPLPSLGLKRRQGGAVKQEAPPFMAGVAHNWLSPYACSFVDRGPWYKWAFETLGLNYYHETFGKRNSIERFFATLKKWTKVFSNNINARKLRIKALNSWNFL
jgi:Transposase and inactivated derivatives